jgi:hypothetical protein
MKTMNTGSIKITLTYSQVLDIVRQLPINQKTKLSRELVKETIDKRLSEFLKTFKTDELTEDIINYEVEKVRTEIYAKKRKS